MSEKPTRKILHITPHLGGGVGTVLLNYMLASRKNSAFVHNVACLDYANDKSITMAKKAGLVLYGNMFASKNHLASLIADSDIVLMHWWNHPLLYDFLVREKMPPCRLVLWSHISGLNPPYVFTDKIFEYPDVFVFTTPISFESKEIKCLSWKQKKKFKVVWSTGGIDKFKTIRSKKHHYFNIGYVGTVDYAKLHPRFLDLCKKINIPDAKFIVCGGSKEREILKEAEKSGIATKFDFTGPVPDIRNYLAVFDILGYPLAPYHYGTCDQVLAESMAAGVVPVVLNNRMEKYMVRDGLTGIIANNEKDYIKAIQKLYKDEKMRMRLSKNAREYAVKNFSVEKMVKEWEAIFSQILKIPKTTKKYWYKKKTSAILAKDVFLESLGSYGKNFISYCKARTTSEKKTAIRKIRKMAESANWQSDSKGSVHQYHSFFPNDKFLSAWSKLMKNT